MTRKRADPLDTLVLRTLDDLSEALLTVRLGAAAKGMFPDGHAGLALAHASLEAVLPGRGHAERAAADVERAIKTLGTGMFGPTLYGGFTGLAWVATYLSKGEDEDDSCAPIDEALLDFLSARSRKWHESYDLIGGLVGYGVYALERLPRPSAALMLERIVEHLAAMATPVAPGISWRSQPSWVPAVVRNDSSRGYNLGLAHGVPGIVALLARVLRAGIAKREAARLLEGGVRWLLAQEMPASSPSAFAINVGGRRKPQPARSGWCYGDPGVAAALLVAGRASGEKAWERAAIRVGLRAAARDPQSAGVVDAGICHGAAGLAQIFARMHAETGEARFRTAARAWIDRTLGMHVSKDGKKTARGRGLERGVGGFRSFGLPPSGSSLEPVWRADAGFLTGSAGITMVLAAHASQQGAGGGGDWAGWDRVLLLSDTRAPATSASPRTRPTRPSRRA